MLLFKKTKSKHKNKHLSLQNIKEKVVVPIVYVNVKYFNRYLRHASCFYPSLLTLFIIIHKG